MTTPAPTTSIRHEIAVEAPIERAFSVDGSECRWARVLAYEPPDRVVFSWDIRLDWTIETDHARTSEVELRFVPDGAERTRVELEHRHLERHGEGWEAMRDAVGSPDGWGVGMRRFAAYVGGRPM